MLLFSFLMACILFVSGCKKVDICRRFDSFKSMIKKKEQPKKEEKVVKKTVYKFTIDSQSAVASVGNLFFTFKEGDDSTITIDVDDFNVPSANLTLALKKKSQFSMGSDTFFITLDVIEKPLESDPTFIVYKISITGPSTVLTLQ